MDDIVGVDGGLAGISPVETGIDDMNIDLGSMVNLVLKLSR
jgi:hypothetical protein